MKDVLRDFVKAFVGVGFTFAIIRLISQVWIGKEFLDRMALVLLCIGLLWVMWDYIVSEFLEE